MPKRTVFERSRRELSLDVSAGVRILLVVEQSSLESQSRVCAKTLILNGNQFPNDTTVISITSGRSQPLIILYTTVYSLYTNLSCGNTRQERQAQVQYLQTQVKYILICLQHQSQC